MKKFRLFGAFFAIVTLCNLNIFAQNPSYSLHNNKMMQLLRQINDSYVDTVDFNKLVEAGTVEILKELDPHSTYIPKKEVQKANEPLQGSFDGIGVTFQLIKDTINIMEVLIGGPSEKVGLLPGDKILKVDTLVAHGKKINNSWVQKHLRGKKGTKVTISVKRGRNPQPLEFVITRDKIPMNSINVYFMVDKETGYIRLERFAQTSTQEFITAITKLKNEGMKNLIFDLRGNGGGYLETAFRIADEFISQDQMIVYTDNFRKTGQKFLATASGNFESGRLVVLVDEGSASASEIVSGAIQDHDRGIIMGRRTFGKGLVQKPIYLTDQSQIRLTISRYYTPSGRCIQRPYNDGLDSYFSDLSNRKKHGEYLTADSIHFPDSLKYFTDNGRVVYGGGGVMPDIFIPLDTSKYSTLYNELFRKGIFGAFAVNYMEENREQMKAKYPTMAEFKKNFEITDELYDQLMEMAHKEGVTDSVKFNFSKRLELFAKNEKKTLDSLFTSQKMLEKNEQEFQQRLVEFLQKSYNEDIKYRNLNKAPEYIKEYLKFEFARALYGYGSAYEIFLLSDDAFLQACKVVKDDRFFRKYKIDK